ncbi:unnamed protein product [marine sediment metagenome]|uniref:Uncharacterized protein n=1 Tax=marine sediment metagenome TaxID=412755 RepID=X1GKJ7_9ZZZZ
MRQIDTDKLLELLERIAKALEAWGPEGPKEEEQVPEEVPEEVTEK